MKARREDKDLVERDPEDGLLEGCLCNEDGRVFYILVFFVSCACCLGDGDVCNVMGWFVICFVEHSCASLLCIVAHYVLRRRKE